MFKVGCVKICVHIEYIYRHRMHYCDRLATCSGSSTLKRIGSIANGWMDTLNVSLQL